MYHADSVLKTEHSAMNDLANAFAAFLIGSFAWLFLSSAIESGVRNGIRRAIEDRDREQGKGRP